MPRGQSRKQMSPVASSWCPTLSGSSRAHATQQMRRARPPQPQRGLSARARVTVATTSRGHAPVAKALRRRGRLYTNKWENPVMVTRNVPQQIPRVLTNLPATYTHAPKRCDPETDAAPHNLHPNTRCIPHFKFCYLLHTYASVPDGCSLLAH